MAAFFQKLPSRSDTGSFIGHLKCYYDAVQEKLGFEYQWTTDDVPVPQMEETRRGHVNLLTKEEWLTNR